MREIYASVRSAAPWRSPLPHDFRPTTDRNLVVLPGESQLPLPPHPGAFGVRRAHHTHEGIDLYCPVGTQVTAVEIGMVVAVIEFTGPKATPPSPWWLPTEAVLVEGESGVIVYGEIRSDVRAGQYVEEGTIVGRVQRVLAKDKGYPTSMLHLELHTHGTRDAFDWIDKKPASLRDPTPFMMNARKNWPARL